MSSPRPVAIALPQDKQVFQLREAAASLGVSLSSIHRWTNDGTLACIRTIGKHHRIPRQAVEAQAIQPRQT